MKKSKKKESTTTTTPPVSDGHPLSEGEVEALLAKLPPLKRAAIAVSGGPDSMALAFCMARWAKAHDRSLPMCFIVDHRLRSESAEEAETVKTRLEALGFEVGILVWSHPSILSRIHVEARTARYALLLRACKMEIISQLLLAHQKEDQAETILFRIAKGSGPDGLAGIAAVSEKDGIHILRPLMSVPKERLIATCRKAQIPFVVDPSNEKEKYARGRLRRILPLLADEGFTIDRLIDLGDRAREAKEALDYYTKAFCAENVTMDKVGVIRIALPALRKIPKATALRVLSGALFAIQPSTYAPQRAVLMPVLDALRAENIFSPRTLGGALVSRSEKDVIVFRESAAIQDVKDIRPGQTVLWDHRWRVHLSDEADGSYVVKALPALTHEQIDALAPPLRRLIPQGRVRLTLPVLWKEGVVAMIPDFTGKSALAVCTATIEVGAA